MEEALVLTVGEEYAHRWAREVREGKDRERVLAGIRQRQIAATVRRFARTRLEGLGRLRMSVDVEAFHFWGQKLGYQCWSDSTFLREFERDNDDVRVPQAGAAATITVPERKSSARKSYTYDPASGRFAA